MFFATFFVLFLSSALAIPVAKRESSPYCSPNFEGAGLSVTNSAREWRSAKPVAAFAGVLAPLLGANGVPGLAVTDFHFQQNGQPDQPPRYVIRPVEGNNLVVNVRTDGSLYLKPFSETDPNQNWNVICDSCNTGASSFNGQFSYGCEITSAVTGQCVQVPADETKPLFLAECNGEDAQNFDFWTKFE